MAAIYRFRTLLAVRGDSLAPAGDPNSDACASYGERVRAACAGGWQRYVHSLHMARNRINAREAVTERVITLMTPAEKSQLETKARKAGVSVGEFVRRSVDAYDPEETRELEQLATLATEFKRSAEAASAAVDRARANVARTLDQLRRGRTA